MIGAMPDRPTKVSFGEMREQGARRNNRVVVCFTAARRSEKNNKVGRKFSQGEKP